MRVVVAISMLLVSTAFSQRWVNAYYTDWDYARMPPTAVDMRGLTNIIFINIDPIGSPPYFQFHWPGQQIFEATAATLIQRAHAVGVKVLLGLGGVWCPGDCGSTAFLNHANDPVWVHNYVQAVTNYARSQGYDGVQLDWEGSVFREGWIRLTDSLRVALNRWQPRGILAGAIAGYIPLNWNNPYDIEATNRNFDYIESMTFDLNGWWRSSSGFNSPLYDPTPNWPGYDGDNVHQAISVWLTRGIAIQKFAIGIPFYGFKWWGISGPTQTGWTNAYWTRYHFVLREDIGYGQVFYDSLAANRWIRKIAGQQGSTETAFVDYQDSASVAKRVQYAIQRGLGGIMIFDLNSGYLDPQNYPNVPDRNPLQSAVRGLLLSASEEQERPVRFSLLQNYPNPFNPSTMISFRLPTESQVKLTVYNLLGQEVAVVADAKYPAGQHYVVFSADNLPAGVYVYQLKANEFKASRKMVLMR